MDFDNINTTLNNYMQRLNYLERCCIDLSKTEVDQLLDDLGANYHDDYHRIAGMLKPVKESFITEYVRNTIGETHKYGLECVEAFQINREEDKSSFRRELNDRRMLWHGTPRQNIYKILRSGFDLNLAKSQGMFGKGLYFSDCCTKSANYCSFFDCRNTKTSIAYLFLCEVALGKIKPCATANYTVSKELGEANSVWGIGSWQAENAKYYKNQIMLCTDPLQMKKRRYLEYNEMVVYSVNQIHMRYLVKVRKIDKNIMCSLQYETYLSSKYHHHLVSLQKYEPKELADDSAKRGRKRSIDSTILLTANQLLASAVTIKPQKKRRVANPPTAAFVQQPTLPSYPTNILNYGNNFAPSTSNFLQPNTSYISYRTSNLPILTPQDISSVLNAPPQPIPTYSNLMPSNYSNSTTFPNYSTGTTNPVSSLTQVLPILDALDSLIPVNQNNSPQVLPNTVKTTTVGTSENPITLEDDVVDSAPIISQQPAPKQVQPTDGTSENPILLEDDLPVVVPLYSNPIKSLPLPSGTNEDPIQIDDEEDNLKCVSVTAN